MIDVTEAECIVMRLANSVPVRHCPLESSVGRVLREEIRADRDQPPFHRVTMDGIALATSALARGNRMLRLQGLQAAGQPPLTLSAENSCIEVMTGAVLPHGCDAVVRIEDVDISEEGVILHDGVSPRPMQNVHPKGSDGRAGEVVVESGTKLSPAQVGIAAAVGQVNLRVSEIPRAAVVSTGDELVGVASRPSDHQVRRSNVYALHAALVSRGFEDTLLCHIADDLPTLERELAALLERCDLLILSGGVSMGKFDYVPTVLERLGVEKHFHGVRQRPGKPLLFGTRGGQAVFALPGNPASSLTCLYRYVLPFLERCAGVSLADTPRVRLSVDTQGLPGLTRFLPVKLEPGETSAGARVVMSNTSGDFLSLGRSDGFVQIEAGAGVVTAGSELPYYPWGPSLAGREASC